MARVISSSYELSGKMGGLVFARNKGGAYVRAFVIPLNPRSVGQLDVRAGWASAVTSWHALDDATKSNWNMFSATDFKPKYPKIGVTYSGFNTYVSCFNELIQNARVQQSGTWLNLTNTVTPFVANPPDPPSAAISNMIKVSTGGPTPTITNTTIQLKNVTVTGTNLTAQFQLGTALSSGQFPVFEDANTNTKVGITIMASYPMTQANQFTLNPKYSFAAVFSPPTFTAGTVTGFLIEVSGTFFTGNKKYNPSPGDVLEFNAFLTSVNGLTQPIGTVKTTIG